MRRNNNRQRRRLWPRPLLLAVAFLGNAALFAGSPSTKWVHNEFPSNRGTTSFNYSPTIVQTTEGLLLAWIGGSGLHHPDASIYLVKRAEESWSRPIKILSAVHPRTLAQKACRRPVLFQPSEETLLIFYKTETAQGRITGWLTSSKDNGITWFPPKSLPRFISGPARTKPIALSENSFLCGGDSRYAGRRFHIEKAEVFRESWSWTRTRDLSSAMRHNASEPVLLDHGEGRLQALCRTRLGHIAETWSENGGKTWISVQRTVLPNPDGGLDAVKLGDRKFALVYQHSNRDRGVLNLAFTEDGRRWSAAAVLESQPKSRFSDPSIVLGVDGNLHLVYSVNHQQVKYVAINPNQLSPVPMVGGNWPY